MQFSTVNGVLYKLSGSALLKIAHGSTRTDEKGRTWFWNAPTKRWRLQKTKPDAPRQIAGLAVLDASEGDIRSVAGKPHEYRDGDWKPLEEGESRQIGGETHVYRGGKFASERDHDKLRSRIEKRLQSKAKTGKPEPANQIVPSHVTDRKWIDSHLKGWNTELTRLGASANEAIEEMQFNEALDEAIDKLQGVIDGIQATLDRADKLRGHDIVDRLNRTYEGKIDQVEARAARLYKRVYEAVHPDKIIRVPKGTTQREYADIVRKIHKGDRETIKQYTVRKPKPKKGKGMKKSAALIKSNDPIRYIMQWNRMGIGVTHDPRFGDSRHGRKVTAGYGHIRGSYGHPDPVSGEAGDGMAIDVWIGCDLGSSEVFRIKQIKPDTDPPELDEWKYVIGCWTEQEATDLYLANMPKMFYGGVEKVSLEALKKYQKPVKLQKSFLLSGTLYQVQQHGDRLVLVKAAKKEVPGQMNLFGGDGGDSHHWDESKHHRDAKGEFTSGGATTATKDAPAKPADKKGFEGRAIAKIQQAQPEVLKNFEQKSKDFIKKIKSMSLSQLQELDLDAEMHDSHYLPAANQLFDAAKDGEHPDIHDDIEELDLDEHAPGLDEAWTKAYGKAEKVLDARINHIENRQDSIPGEAGSEMNIQGPEILENEPTTLQEWQEKQAQLKGLHASIKAKYQTEASRLGIDEPDWSELDQELEWMLDEYSNDSEDWED